MKTTNLVGREMVLVTGFARYGVRVEGVRADGALFVTGLGNAAGWRTHVRVESVDCFEIRGTLTH
jgi:hypothetical protein